MWELLNLDKYILQHVCSYLSVMDLCEMLCVSKKVDISFTHIQKVSVNGFYLYEFIIWLRKHNIRRISNFRIENYLQANDHCMMNYREDCDCIDVIVDTLEEIEVKTLELFNVDLQVRSVKWKYGVESLYFDHCFDVEWINDHSSIRKMVLMYHIEYYFPEPLEVLLDGLKLPSLQYFETNGFIFEDDVYNFLKRSDEIETLRTFRIQSLIDSENYTEIAKRVTDKFRNASFEVY